jgi:murein DD-endopeptidase MepM/ murein hydrolase activator NlpD
MITFTGDFMMALLLKIFTRKRIMLLSVILITICLTTLLVYSTKAYEVRIDNKYIGVVKNQNLVTDILREITVKAEIRYDTPILVSSGISYKDVYLTSKNRIVDGILYKQIESSVILTSKAFAINVDGKDMAYLKDKPSAEEVLNKIKAPYIQNADKNTNIGFLENVSIIQKDISPIKLKGPEEVFNNIVLQSNQVKKYTVQEGDTISEIAENLGIRVEDIRKANPTISIDDISIGQELSLVVPRYVINIKQITYKTSEEKIPFDITYEDTSGLYKGESKVKTSGAEGRKLVKTEIVSINGILEETKVTGEKVLEKPKAEIALRGTKVRPRTIATGVFSNPSRGSLTSRFGERWSRQHIGIDIGVPRGTPNKAADGGVVIFAGRDGTYGKLIIISHENGYTTYYAHNNTIKVKKGQRVAKGQVIGTAGSTGRATGPHLHFEVRKNGVPVNPLKYIHM